MSNGLINRQYVGARYVPKIMGEWDKALQYEALSVVTYMGNSFTSKVPVPANIEITNEDYWVNTGNYNAQIESYRKETENIATLLKSAIVNVKDFGAKGNGIADDSTNIQNAIDYANTNGGYIYFPKGSYLLSNTLIIKNSCVFVGDNYNNTVLIINGEKPIFKNDDLDNHDIFKLHDTSFFNMTLQGVNKHGIGVEISNNTDLANLPFFRFNNVRFTNLNKGVYLEGYGHTFKDCYFGGNNVGVSLIHAEQVSLENCWIEYNKIGLTVNNEKIQYGHNFHINYGAIQRNEIGAKIFNTDDIFINTYCEENKVNDIQCGDVNDETNYTKGCHNVNININTSNLTKTTSTVLSACTYGNISINCYSNMIPCRINGFCKYLNINLYGQYEAELTGDASKYCKIYKNNFLTNVPINTQNIEAYNETMVKLLEYQHNTMMVTKKFKDSGENVILSKDNHSGCYWSDTEDEILRITTDVTGKRKVMVKGDFQLYDKTNTKFVAMRIDNNKLQLYVDGAWKSLKFEV